MAEENKNVETPEGQGNEEQNEQTQPEKKYTDEEVNNISVKNSKKAVAKLMKELGITEKTDRAKVKELIEKAQKVCSPRLNRELQEIGYRAGGSLVAL